MIRVGVIGYGYWGPGIVRNFHAVEGCEVAVVCDKSPSALKRAKQAYPSVEVTSDPCEVLSATDIDAVAVKPGITGPWQVGGRSKTTFDEMVRMDLKYASSWTPWTDFTIILRTPRAVFSGEGAY